MNHSSIVAKPVVGRFKGEAYDLESTRGVWLGWVRRVEGRLRLASTSAPLTDEERRYLAWRATGAIEETVSP
jgi:hypothetical protein